MSVVRISHRTAYGHGSPTAACWQVVRLRPRDEPGQDVLSFDLRVRPAANDIGVRRDFFGNTCHVFNLLGSHQAREITSVSRVRKVDPTPPLVGLSPAAVLARELADAAIIGGEYELDQFRYPTPHVPLLGGAADLARGLDPQLPLLEWVDALGAHFAEAFTYDPSATNVTSPMGRILKTRRGVCQDFAHVLLSCLRQHGLPAAYVSGYLLTAPPPGRPRLIGADAMHAWVSVWIPGTGWIDYDPTNRCFAGEGHIVVARGRDYADVCPVCGVFRGGSAHALTVEVTVEPEEA